MIWGRDEKVYYQENTRGVSMPDIEYVIEEGTR